MNDLTIRRILVAVKNPAAAISPAVEKAAQLAQRLQAELALFHAIDLPLSANAYLNDERRLGDDKSSIQRDYLQALEQHAIALRAQVKSISVAVDWDFPAPEALLRHACAHGVDLIVIGESAHATAHPFVREMLRLSPLPVLVVRNAHRYQVPAIIATLDARRSDASGRDLASAVCRHAQTLSASLGGSWYLIDIGHRQGQSATARLLRQDSGRDFRTDLGWLLRGSHPLPRSIRRPTRQSAQTVFDTAKSMRAQLIVVGMDSRFGLMHLHSGTTARQLFEHSSRDILVVKPHGFGEHFSHRVRGAQILSAGMPPVVWHQRPF